MKGQAEAVGVLGDATVLDAEFVETGLPLLKLAPVGTTEAHVIKPGAELVGLIVLAGRGGDRAVLQRRDLQPGG